MFAASSGLLLRVYAAAIFLSAALLFAVQPMFTKMVLPKLGGSPSVWSVAMVFFQAVLLAGYAYAHLITRYVPGRIAVMVHLAVMVIAMFALPLTIAAGWGRPPTEGEALWLLGLFAVSIGLPFFALSANGPLLQAWFARTDHPAAANPYFLYAASNVGSFLALISYPFVVEPFSRLGDQTRGWSALFYLLILLIAACGFLMLRRPGTNSVAAGADTVTSAGPGWRDAATFVALAAVPSGLLVAVTAHISTDVAAVPLLWVVPLALYLLTFVIVFSTRPIIPLRLIVWVQPLLLVALAGIIVYETIDHIIVLISVHIVAFFVTALVCHGELARRRPAAGHLTAFYMWMSLGGVVGGIFSGLVAPHVFSWVAEYPLLIVCAALCRPGIAIPRDRNAIAITTALVVLAIAAVIPALAFDTELDDSKLQTVLAVVLTFAFVLSFLPNPLHFALSLIVVFAVYRFYEPDGIKRDTVRSFFGVHKITETGDFRVLLHGTTIHGAERVTDEEEKPGDKPEPLTYYHAKSAIVQAIKAVRERRGQPIAVAVVGLGTGSLACQMEAGDRLTYYEIDPSVVAISKDPERFTFLAKCAPNVPIVLGDARLTLADAADGAYDIIVVDAFSSDTIPVHLLTQQAMALFASKLAPNGVVAMHVSNRHMELASVVAGIAGANGLVSRVNGDVDEDTDDDKYKFSSTVVAVARADADFGPLAKPEGWQVKQPDAKQRVWTDDYTNVVGAIIRQIRE